MTILEVPATPVKNLGHLNLSPAESFVLQRAEAAYDEGLRLRDWYLDIEKRDNFHNKFLFSDWSPQRGHSFGFLCDAPYGATTLPMMGSVQHFLFDRDRPPAQCEDRTVERIAASLKEFVFRYYWRSTAIVSPQIVLPDALERPNPVLPSLSICPRPEDDVGGAGFFQLFKKRKSDGWISRFPIQERAAIIDMRRLGHEYDWIICAGRQFNFEVTLRLLGVPVTLRDPDVMVALLFPPYLVNARDYTGDNASEAPEKGVVAEYCVGNVFIENPRSGEITSGGAQRFYHGFNWFRFRLYDTTEIWVKKVFVANQIRELLPLSVNPLIWGQYLADLGSLGLASRAFEPFDKLLSGLPYWNARADLFGPMLTILNRATGDALGRNYCLSVKDFQRLVLRVNYMKFFDVLAQASRVWHQVADWRDEESLPDWMVHGSTDPLISGAVLPGVDT